jgi:hypothetical protein
MKVQIISKNAIRMEGTDFFDQGLIDYDPLCIGKISFSDSSYPIASGGCSLFLEVYLFYKDFENEN